MQRISGFKAHDGLELLSRGDRVVLRTGRGTELGEVLAIDPPQIEPPEENVVLRRATEIDLAIADQASLDRVDRFERCLGVFDNGIWPLSLIDVEALLDENRTIAYYLGPHGLDDLGLREAIRNATGLDVRLEATGIDGPAEQLIESSAHCGSGGCGSCSSGGGCGGCPVAGRRRS
jgi:cell fate regulator YaaT (PSP1 superfamily)